MNSKHVNFKNTLTKQCVAGTMPAGHCMFACWWLTVLISADRQTYKKTYRLINRQRGRETYRQTDRQTD